MSFRFQVECCPRADRVYLLLRVYHRISQLVLLEPPDTVGGPWRIKLDLPAGDHEYRVYAYEGDRLTLCASLAGPSGSDRCVPCQSPSTAQQAHSDLGRYVPAPAEAVVWANRWSRFPAGQASCQPYAPGHYNPFRYTRRFNWHGPA